MSSTSWVAIRAARCGANGVIALILAFHRTSSYASNK